MTAEARELICELAQLDDSGSYGFNVDFAGESIDGFVVKCDGECFAYRNICPHTESPLEWQEHQFLDSEGALIQCAVHEARFLMDTGECVYGPCVGERLSALPIHVEAGCIYLVGVA